jgi:hypothetical protein
MKHRRFTKPGSGHRTDITEGDSKKEGSVGGVAFPITLVTIIQSYREYGVEIWSSEDYSCWTDSVGAVSENTREDGGGGGG